MPKQRYADDDALHAEGRHARPRHDVPHGDHPGEPRLRRRGRHGQEAARVAGAAADRHGAVRLLAVHRRASLNGFKSMRSEVWRDTDRRRTGMLPFVFEAGMGYERYVDYALAVPMYFVYRDGRYIDVAGASFRDFLDGKLPQLPGERPTLDDWSDHLTTLFPEVRLKRFLEMRGADSGPWQRICALPAFWVGPALRRARRSMRPGSSSRTGPPRSARRCATRCPRPRWRRRSATRPCSTSPARCCASRAAGCARAGASTPPARTRPSTSTSSMRSRISGCTLADRLIERYEGPWSRDIDHVFEEYAF